MVFYLLSFEQICLFCVAEDHVFGHQIVVGNIHEQFFLHEHLNIEWVLILKFLYTSTKKIRQKWLSLLFISQVLTFLKI